MKKYKIIYTLDNGRTKHEAIIEAKDHTKAYLETCYQLPINLIITDLTEITENNNEEKAEV